MGNVVQKLNFAMHRKSPSKFDIFIFLYTIKHLNLLLNLIRMAKTNKEFRSDLAKEMFDKLNQRNEQLEKIEKSPYSEWLKEQKRKEIMENFEREIDNMKKRPWYEEAKQTHIDEIKAKHSLDTARERRNRLWQEKERLERELRRADDDMFYRRQEYNESQINHGWELENDSFVPEWIEENRIKRRESEYLDEKWENQSAKKVKMMELMDKLPVRREKEDVESYGFAFGNNAEFRLGNKKYKISLPESYINCWVTFTDLNEVEDERVNEYLKEKEWEWFHLPKKEQIESILQELGKIINTDKESDEIAMLSYLLGMGGESSVYLLDGDFDIWCDFLPGNRWIQKKMDTKLSAPKKLFLIKEE